MRVTGTLYVTDHRARVAIRRGTIIVEQPSGWQRVPIETLDGVVLTGRAEITNHAIGELVRRGVRIAALSKTGPLRFAVGGPVSGNVHLRIAQLKAAIDPFLTAPVARWVVAGKLQNCRRAMLRWSWDATGLARTVMNDEIAAIGDRLQSLDATIDGDKIRGIEGDASRRYFKCMAIHMGSSDERLTMQRRTRRPPRDPANALLSFTYGLVLSELIGALDVVGLDPPIGYLHRARSGRPSLALDLLEEGRPSLADRFSLAVLTRSQIRPSDFSVVGDAHYLTDEGRVKLLELYEQYRNEELAHPLLGRRIGRWTLPNVQATLMARYLRGDLPCYPPFVMSP
jgi:CRISPR-associated protein Cas1